MSHFQILTVIATFAFLYSLVATRLEKTPVNGALVYVLVGLICGPEVLGLVNLEVDGVAIQLLAELTLAVILFTDAADANLAVLRKIEKLPIRMLSIGLPLIILLGFFTGWLIFDGMDLFALALLATMLAPTDAALGKAVVTNANVPDSVREGLKVESGVNDGICVPVLLLFMELATEVHDRTETIGMALHFSLQAIGIGTLVGVLVAYVGGKALKYCERRNWIAGTWIQIPVIALSLVCFGLAQWLGGSGFIAAFVGGLLFGGITRYHKQEVLNGAEGIGDLLSLITWFAYGAVVVGSQVHNLTWQIMLYSVLSLTVIRMLPIWLSLNSMGLHRDTKLFVGWFGPRGLASIVFAVMVASRNLPQEDTLLAVVTSTILLSVVLHGLSANPLAKFYGKRVSRRNGVL